MLQNLTAVVTGSGRGIGKAVALALARQGAHVIVNDLDPEAVQNVVEEIKGLGGQASAWAHDISRDDTIESLTETINKTTAKLHILVNNAAIGSEKRFLDLSPSAWNMMLNINLNSVFYCCQAAIPFMLESSYGRIINIASSAALRGGGLKGSSGYAASKAGVIGLTKGLAREFAGKGICAVAVAPSYHETPGHADLSIAEKQAILSHIPINVPGNPADLAEIITFLASRYTRFMTGSVIAVDGGFTMH
ncbi:MAG: SDR family oxidoreductase [Bacillota bacterium]|jgi:NAD(P)-dependent dehydrogenase (short-subunit alcohol dehydrogenase family)